MRKTSEFDRDTKAACEAASMALSKARSNTQPLSGFPGTLPETMEQAYAIQSASIHNWHDQVAGWKVAMMPPSHQTLWHSERLCGPIFSHSVVHTPDCSAVCMPIYPIGFSAVEAEFVLIMGKTVFPEQRQYSDKELAELIKDMHIGVEIASSPLASINQIGTAAVISDFGNNGGLVVGPVVKDGLSRALDSLRIKAAIDDRIVGESSAQSIPGGPLQALRFLLDICAARDITVSKGEFISTGAVTGVHEVNLTSRASIKFDGIGHLNLTFGPRQPQ